MLSFDPKRHPEQKLAHKSNTEFSWTGFQNGMENFPSLHYSNRDHQASWERYNSHGTLSVDVTLNKVGGSLSIVVSEVRGEGRSQKQTFATLPKEVVDALRIILVTGNVP